MARKSTQQAYKTVKVGVQRTYYGDSHFRNGRGSPAQHLGVTSRSILQKRGTKGLNYDRPEYLGSIEHTRTVGFGEKTGRAHVNLGGTSKARAAGYHKSMGSYTHYTVKPSHAVAAAAAVGGGLYVGHKWRQHNQRKSAAGGHSNTKVAR